MSQKVPLDLPQELLFIKSLLVKAQRKNSLYKNPFKFPSVNKMSYYLNFKITELLKTFRKK